MERENRENFSVNSEWRSLNFSGFAPFGLNRFRVKWLSIPLRIDDLEIPRLVCYCSRELEEVLPNPLV